MKESYEVPFKEISFLEIGGSDGSELSVRITYKGKDYDGYLLEVEK